ncbi:hypothetical protein [Bordetella genomosp. 13]|uniref:hypothetical protein n=1 Tax=Bordetella genomosp. 13 TaxID=463040 RepID=UPI0011A46308|nr:hypothetical protein [Bordetella genomosp. 13]
MLNRIIALVGAMLLCLASGAHGAQAPADPPADPPKAEIDALKQGYAALQAQQPDAAVQAFRGLSTSANPDMAALALEGLGHAYRQKRDYSKTVVAFEKSLALPTTMPRDLPAIHQQIGMAAVLAGHYGTAVTHLESWKASWTAREPSKSYDHAPGILVYLAAAQAEQRDYPQARQAIRQSLELKPSDGAKAIQAAIERAAKAGKASPGAVAGLLHPGS